MDKKILVLNNIADYDEPDVLKSGHNKLLSIFNSIDEPIYVTDPNTYEILYINQTLRKVLGDVEGKICHKVFQGLNKPCPFCTNKYLFGGNNGKKYIWEWQNKVNKHWYHCIDNVIDWPNGRKVRLELAIDITEGKKAKEALSKSEDRYRSIFENSRDAIYITQRGGKIIDVNRAALKLFGYKKKEIKDFNISDAFVNPKDCNILQEALEKKGSVKNFEIKLRKKNGTVIACLLTANVRRSDNNAIIGYEGIIRDITDKKHIEEALKKSLEKSERIIKGTIQAMSKAVEMRDPYTAGHQRRVSKLSCIIAKMMGLKLDQIEAVNVAGVLHDIGKIYVPAEILASPRRLNKIEMDLIREHPRIGYEILKTEEFPWPIAKIVLQHHERLDGSGYPLGISEKDIMIEARILAVADTVEAMVSHRPYRAALGIDKALEEISNNKGLLYDIVVVDTCVKFFSRKKRGLSLNAHLK